MASATVKIFFALAALAVCAAVSILFGYLWVEHWSSTEQALPGEVLIEFPRGTPLDTLSEQLANRGVVSSQELFKIWTRLNLDYAKFQAGKYRFYGAVTPRDVADAFINGRVFREIQVRFTIPEGFTLRQIVSRAVSLGVGTEEEFTRLVSDQRYVTELTRGRSSLEGYLFPETFHFYTKPSPDELIRRAVREFWSRLPSDYEQSAQARGLSLHDAVIFASLIERETPSEGERPLISEVIWRRLASRQPLGIDAAVIYGIPDFNGNLTRSDLDNKGNPYNLRIHPGLPPTPICSPSLESLRAVLTPASEGNLYYVVDADDLTKHVFSKSLTEHNQHVRRLVRAQRERRRHDAAGVEPLLTSPDWVDIPASAPSVPPVAP